MDETLTIKMFLFKELKPKHRKSKEISNLNKNHFICKIFDYNKNEYFYESLELKEDRVFENFDSNGYSEDLNRQIISWGTFY